MFSADLPVYLILYRQSMTPQGVRTMRRKKVTSSISQRVDISFPPGRPTADTIEALCDNQNQRPRYNVRCLPRMGYGWLVRQAKTINRMENGFKRCCKKKGDVLSCADQKVKQETWKNKYFNSSMYVLLELIFFCYTCSWLFSFFVEVEGGAEQVLQGSEGWRRWFPMLFKRGGKWPKHLFPKCFSWPLLQYHWSAVT